MKLPLIVCVLGLMVTRAPAERSGPQADFYVAVDGNDANAGTLQSPFASVERARDAVGKRIAGGLKSDVKVLVRGGTYRPAKTLTFGPEDSGTDKHSIRYESYPGETVLISGGRRIIGWKHAANDLWTAEAAAMKDGAWSPRQLYVDEARALRARSPNVDSASPFLQMLDARNSRESFTLKFPPGQVKGWSNPSAVEVFMRGNWAINRKRVQSVNEETGIVTLALPHIPPLPWNTPRKGRWSYFENAVEFLDQPGEWHLNPKSGFLSYLPLPGQDMTKAEVVAPMLTRLLEVAGTPERPVRNLHFKGIRFEHAAWDLPPGGYMGVQACHYITSEKDKKAWKRIEAAVRWNYVESSSLTDGGIAHVGGCGIELVTRCRNNVIEGNHVFDVSGNGIMLGGPKEEEDVPKNNRIANNHVHACGVDFHGSVGIWAGFSQGAVITNNRVHDLPYTGISVGWQWDPKPTPCKENRIENNHIFDVMKELGDGGGIYTLGLQPGTIIRGNHIHDVKRSRFAQAAPNNGMFIDQGSKSYLFAENVIYSTAGRPVRFNQCGRDWHTWKDNHFGKTRTVPGKVGSGLLCDGTGSFHEAPHTPKLDPEQLTVEAWVYLDRFPSGKDTRRWLVNKNRNEWIEGHYALMVQVDRVGAYLNIGGGRGNENSAWSQKGAIKLKQWHHAAMTYDGKELIVYLDGKQVASKTIGKKRKAGRDPVHIGRRQDGYNYFKGIIDEVRIYDRALSANETKSHHDLPEAERGTEKGMAGHWSFDGIDDSPISEIITRAGLEPEYRNKLLGSDNPEN
ncbi:MAG: right-handed parallel beta-helix repeat-containing protein [Planctomycetota bacterium]|nr:right-handed parallel beta-helix repeat-containing protein [Planctomycetota bacterium]